MKRKALLLSVIIGFAQPAFASIAPPPTTEKAKENLAEYGPVENLALFQLVDGIDDGAFNS